MKMGEADTVQVGLSEVGKLLVKKDQLSSVTTEVELKESLQAPVAKGAEVGQLVISVDGKEARRIALVTQAEVPRLTFSGIFSGMLERMATGHA